MGISFNNRVKPVGKLKIIMGPSNVVVPPSDEFCISEDAGLLGESITDSDDYGLITDLVISAACDSGLVNELVS